MSDRPPVLALLILVLAASPAAAEPAVTILDLPFKVRAMRGPASEVAVSVATSGLLPLARARTAGPAPEAGEGETAPIVVVWGEGGGAALGLVDGAVRTTLLGAEAIEGLAAAETPRGALPGSRRALSGPLSAYLTGPTRALGTDAPAAAGLTIRERQPVAMGGDPKPVPVSTATVPAGPDAVFTPGRPRTLRLAGQPALVAATRDGAGRAGLALVARAGTEWRVVARTPARAADGEAADKGLAGDGLTIAGVADFAGTGAPQLATVRAGGGPLQLWTVSADAFAPAGEAPGYRIAGDAELAAVIDPEAGGAPDLALPTTEGTALAVVAFKGGIRERARAALPAAAAFGVAALGRGRDARVLVGLADGRVAVVTFGGAAR